MSESLRRFLASYPQVDANRLLLEAGIDPSIAGDHEAMHEARSILTLLEVAARETGNECFGLDYAAQESLKCFDVFCYVFLHSPTLGVAIDNAQRYLAVQQNVGKLAVDRGPVDACVSYRATGPAGVGVRQHVDMVLVTLMRSCRAGLGQPKWAAREVHFASVAPADPSRYERFFGARVRFAQAENAVIIPSEELALPFKAADAGLLPILRRHADDLLARIPVTGDVTAIVRRQLAEMVSAGNVEIEAAAARMGTTTRSLQRRLSESGQSFQQLLAETRLALAQQYLGDPSLSLTEIAFLVGYSDLSAFSRAFRRWTHQSPLDYRRRGNAGASEPEPL